MKKYVISAKKGLGGNLVSIDVSKAKQLQKNLQQAYDILESMDDETFQAVDGESMIDDLDTYIHEVATTLDTYTNMENY